MFDYQLSVDFSWLERLADQPYYVIFWHFLVNGGWILFVAALLYGAWINFVYYKQSKFSATQSFVFLAVDIPKNNLQTPRAVENIFTALAGAHTPLDWHEKKFKGMFQVGFSFEIVSIDGYVQFIIRTPTQFRSLVEATIYSQYPEAEITETVDYAQEANVTFPSDEYNLWGADMVPVKPGYYPIKTYLEFQEMLDNEFKDPMAALLEVMNKIGPGEQIWLQIIIIPADNDWMKEGTKAVNKILGVPEKPTKSPLGFIVEPLFWIAEIVNQLTGAAILPTPAAPVKAEAFNMMKLTPQQKIDVEAIMRKIDKICFNCKVRLIYYGRREVFKKGLAVSGVVGALKQFTSTGLNSLKPGGNKTQAKLFLKDMRLADMQNKILKDYKSRNADTVKGTHILSVEELATLWHFPYIEVRAPLVKKIEAKRSSAPVGLPIDDEEPPKEDKEKPKAPTPKSGPVPVIDYDNNYFEERFALDKTMETDRQRKQEILQKLKETQPEKKKVFTRFIEDEIVSAEDQFEQFKNKVAEDNLPESLEKTQEENFKKDDDDSPGNLPIV